LRWGRVVWFSFVVKDVAVMAEEHAPNEAAMKIAEEGIRGMINALVRRRSRRT
jgi:hypothetical protein